MVFSKVEILALARFTPVSSFKFLRADSIQATYSIFGISLLVGAKPSPLLKTFLSLLVSFRFDRFMIHLPISEVDRPSDDDLN